MKIAIELYDPKTNEIIKYFSSIQEAATKLDWSYYRVKNCATKNIPYKKMYVRYADNSENL